MADPLARLRRSEPGERWVVRVRLADGSATDVTGWVAARSDLGVTVAGPLEPDADDDRPAPTRTVPYALVVAARKVPVAAGGPNPSRTSADELERLAAPAWAAAMEPLGDWTLRSAAGFSGRANSCLAVGDPGVTVDAAAERVIAYARTHGIAPMAQVVTGSENDRALQAYGWVETYVATDVLTLRLADLLGDDLPDPRVTVSQTLTPQWRAAYVESRPTDVDPDVVTAILDGRPPRAYASLLVDNRIGALARGHLGGPWLGLASIWTRPELRRHGLATATMLSLGHWAARRGARYCYLQVASENVAAQRAYATLGFTLHHRYRYLAPDPQA